MRISILEAKFARKKSALYTGKCGIIYFVILLFIHLFIYLFIFHDFQTLSEHLEYISLTLILDLR